MLVVQEFNETVTKLQNGLVKAAHQVAPTHI